MIKKKSNEERIELYQTIQHTQHQINHIQTSNLISSKRKQELMKNFTDIEPKIYPSNLWLQMIYIKNTTHNNNPKDIDGTNYIDYNHPCGR